GKPETNDKPLIRSWQVRCGVQKTAKQKEKFLREKVDQMLDQGKSSNDCDQCGKPFGPKNHGGGSSQRFCTYRCRMAWHAAQRKSACTLAPKNSVSPSQPSPRNAPVNALRGFDRTARKSRTLSERLKTTMSLNGHGLLIRQSCNLQD